MQPILEKKSTKLEYKFKDEFTLFNISYSEDEGEISIEDGTLEIGYKDFPMFVKFINLVYEDLKESFPEDFKE